MSGCRACVFLPVLTHLDGYLLPGLCDWLLLSLPYWWVGWLAGWPTDWLVGLLAGSLFYDNHVVCTDIFPLRADYLGIDLHLAELWSFSSCVQFVRRVLVRGEIWPSAVVARTQI